MHVAFKGIFDLTLILHIFTSSQLQLLLKTTFLLILQQRCNFCSTQKWSFPLNISAINVTKSAGNLKVYHNLQLNEMIPSVGIFDELQITPLKKKDAWVLSWFTIRLLKETDKCVLKVKISVLDHEKYLNMF